MVLALGTDMVLAFGSALCVFVAESFAESILEEVPLVSPSKVEEVARQGTREL
jgi:hypothetical protein